MTLYSPYFHGTKNFCNKGFLHLIFTNWVLLIHGSTYSYDLSLIISIKYIGFHCNSCKFCRCTCCDPGSHYAALPRIVAPRTYNSWTASSPTGAVAKCWTCVPRSCFNNITIKVYMSVLYGYSAWYKVTTLVEFKLRKESGPTNYLSNNLFVHLWMWLKFFECLKMIFRTNLLQFEYCDTLAWVSQYSIHLLKILHLQIYFRLYKLLTQSGNIVNQVRGYNFTT